MKLLPSEQKERVDQALSKFQNNDVLVLSACNCNNPQAGNFGRNYTHNVVTFHKDSGEVFINKGTCNANEKKNWVICNDLKKEIELFYSL